MRYLNLSAALLTFALVGCGGGENPPWSGTTVQSFMNGCTGNGGSSSQCSCLIEGLQTSFSEKFAEAEFTKILLNQSADTAFVQKVAELTVSCRAQ